MTFFFLLALVLSLSPFCVAQRPPIILDRSGGFSIGGTVVPNPANGSETLSCDHAYVEYFMPARPRQASLVMWHSSSTQTFQNRWDGGEGYKDMFLRRNYPVYLWEGPGVGRANWGCAKYTYEPSYRDQGNFVAWNLGPTFPDFWPDTQFPTANRAAAWADAVRTRYFEFDSDANMQLHSDVAAAALDSGRLGDSVVLVANSGGGIRALMAVAKTKKDNVKAVVLYEISGSILPEGGVPGLAANGTKNDGFGPRVVPRASFERLAKLRAVQFVWGDHRSAADLARLDQSKTNWTEYVENSRATSRLINEYGGNSEVLMLGDDAGLKGSSHLAFMDMDNDKVAGLLDDFLHRNGLDNYARKAPK